MISAGIFGGSGYAGAELLRWLLAHPEVELRFVTSRTHAGRRIAEVLPNLAPFCDLSFAAPQEASIRDVEAVFLCLEHNASQEVVPLLLAENPELKIIDLGGDFRTPDPEGYQRYYGVRHAACELLDRFVYGFVEANRDELRRAQLVANPGCFATSLLLGLWPVQKAGKLTGDVAAFSVTGSSGAGVKLRETTHHPARATNMRAYKILTHQHLLEVVHFLQGSSWHLHFVPHSGPFVRGIFTTVVFSHLAVSELSRLYEEAYREAPLVSVVRGTPELRMAQNSAVSFVGSGGTEKASAGLVAIDNLAKGAATQAVQSFNLMFGLEETTGLALPPGFV